MRDDAPMDRRRFFREGLRELFKPLANAAEPIQRVLRELEELNPVPPPPAKHVVPLRMVLRPPGALDEQMFKETCSRSGQCVNVSGASLADLAKLIQYPCSGSNNEFFSFTNASALPAPAPAPAPAGPG